MTILIKIKSIQSFWGQNESNIIFWNKNRCFRFPKMKGNVMLQIQTKISFWVQNKLRVIIWTQMRDHHVCRHQRKNSILSFILFILFFLDTEPHLASVVCDLYLFSVSRYESCVCVGTCVRVCVWAQIWSRHQPWEILRCDWAPMSNRFYLV